MRDYDKEAAQRRREILRDALPPLINLGRGEPDHCARCGRFFYECPCRMNLTPVASEPRQQLEEE